MHNVKMTIRFCFKNVALKTSNMLQGTNCKNCHLKCGKGNVSPDVLAILDAGYAKLVDSNSKSLLKKYLTKDVFNILRDVRTPMGSTLLDCIKSGEFDFN